MQRRWKMHVMREGRGIDLEKHILIAVHFSDIPSYALIKGFLLNLHVYHNNIRDCTKNTSKFIPS